MQQLTDVCYLRNKIVTKSYVILKKKKYKNTNNFSSHLISIFCLSFFSLFLVLFLLQRRCELTLHKRVLAFGVVFVVFFFASFNVLANIFIYFFLIHLSSFFKLMYCITQVVLCFCYASSFNLSKIRNLSLSGCCILVWFIISR